MQSVSGKLPLVFFFLSALIFIFHAVGAAQDLDYVSVSGKITDSNNAALPGATVTVVITATGVERTAVTNEDGFYKIVKLEPGTYTVRFSANGFAAKEQIVPDTIAGKDVQLSVSLLPAGVTAEQTVLITDEPSPVDITRTVVGGTVTQREIEELPNVSRNPLDLIFTLGGVAEEPFSQRDLAEDKGAFRESAGSAYNTPEEAGVFSLSGGAAYSNNITIDGLDNNDDRSANLRFTPSLDAIEEVQVITNQFSAEYGRASGGRVNFRTRGGGKKFRGRISYFFEDDALNANTWRNNMRGIPRPDLQKHIPVFSFGGPLPIGYFKKKTFFFAAYEYQNFREDALIDTFVPVGQNSIFALPAPTNPGETVTLPNGDIVAPYDELVPTPLNNHTLTARLDHNFTDRHNITFGFQYGDRRDFRQFSGGTRLADALLGKNQKTQGYNFTDNYVFSKSAVNQLRFQYSTLEPQVVTDTRLDNPVVLITIPSSLNVGTTLIAGSTLGSSARRENRWQIQENLTIIAGMHTLRFGGDVQNVKSRYSDRADATGTFNFASVNDFLNNNVSRYRQNFGRVSEIENTYTGIFIQDDWRLRPNLTVNFGLRYEYETVLDDKNNFGPRAAVAWSPFRDKKGVIRLGAGLFYNRALLRTIDDNRLTLVNDSIFFDTGTRGSSSARVPESVFQSLSSNFPKALTESEARQLCSTYSLNCTGEGNFSNSIDPNIELPESYQFNVGFEREIGNGFVFEANYTYNKTAKLWRRVSTNSVSLDILNQKTGGNFSSLAEYLMSTSFDNRRVNGARPIYSASSAQDVVRFVTSFTPPPVGDPARCSGTIVPTNPLQGGCARVNGVQTTFLNLNGPIFGSTTPQYAAAMNALNQFRPDPNGLTDAKQIRSIGNSEYNGLILEFRRRYRKIGRGFGSSFRLVYTLSKSMDDGFSNTSQAQIIGDFSSEWARSLNDRRHRFALSGTFDTPAWLGKLRFSPILKLGSSAPFNISAGGIDRNLDDVSNDRPNYSGDLSRLVYRNPGDPFPQDVFDAFSQITLGTSGGNLPRNAGRGPGYFLFDLNISRVFKFTERMRLRPSIEIDNVLNARVFNFGGAFINVTDPQADFLVPTRTFRPRQIRLGLRFDF